MSEEMRQLRCAVIMILIVVALVYAASLGRKPYKKSPYEVNENKLPIGRFLIFSRLLR